MKISRGLRNKNPLNIRRNSTKWKGLAKVQADKEFFSFEERCWGYRAAFVTLRNYSKRHGIKTLGGWVARWAPPVENDTAAYTAFVARKTGIAAEAEVECFFYYLYFQQNLSIIQKNLLSRLHSLKNNFRYGNSRTS